MTLRTKIVRATIAAGTALSLIALPATALAEGFSGSVTLDENSVMPLTTVTVEYGASWDYGSIPFVHGWSSLFSSTRWHSATVTATGATHFSGKTAPAQTAWADLWFKFPTFNAYYNIW